MTRKELLAQLTQRGHTGLILRRKKNGQHLIIQPVYGNARGRIDGEGNTWQAAFELFKRRAP